MNFIVLGFITFTLVAQFGVHIKVDKGMELIPIEIGYSQSTVHINSKFVDVSNDMYVYSMKITHKSRFGCRLLLCLEEPVKMKSKI